LPDALNKESAARRGDKKQGERDQRTPGNPPARFVNGCHTDGGATVIPTGSLKAEKKKSKNPEDAEHAITIKEDQRGGGKRRVCW